MTEVFELRRKWARKLARVLEDLSMRGEARPLPAERGIMSSLDTLADRLGIDLEAVLDLLAVYDPAMRKRIMANPRKGWFTDEQGLRHLTLWALAVYVRRRERQRDVTRRLNAKRTRGAGKDRL